MRTVLITGFGPFPGITNNASAALAEALDGATLGTWRVVGRRLETSWTKAWPMLQAAVEAVAPQALVMVGVAPRDVPNLECVARNISEARKDCDGELPRSTLLADGPAEWHTTLPSAGVEAAGGRVSQDAGVYLCNAVFYLAMHHLGHIPHRGFVHIPQSGLWPGLRFVGHIIRNLPAPEAATT